MKWENMLERCRKFDSFPLMEDFFSTCPELIKNHVSLVSFPKDRLIIETGSPCDTVYFLIGGRLSAIEEEAGEIPYCFFEADPFDILGDYELFFEHQANFVTIRAREPSVCLSLPAPLYLQWISHDSRALFIRMKLLMRKVYGQLRFDRRFLMMPHDYRCMYMISQECLKLVPDRDLYRLKINREELAAKTGCSLRTIQRILQSLAEKGFITLSGGKIVLDAGQLLLLQGALDEYLT